MNSRSLIIAILMGTALAFGIWASVQWSQQSSRESAQPTIATVLSDTTPVPDFSLLDHNGHAVDRRVFEGQWDLVFFGFTHCPDICPLTLQTLQRAKQQMRDAGVATLPRIVLVSVDPERDTPEKLASYIDLFGTDNLGLTGELDEVRRLAKGLYVYFEKHASDDSDDTESYTVDHSAVVLLIDPEGRAHAVFSSPHTAENFAHDLPLLTRS